MGKKQIFLMALVISLLFNSTIAFALSYSSNSGKVFFEEDNELINNFSCSTESLSPEEVEAFQKNVLETGFAAQDLSSGSPPIEDREVLENNTALLISPDSNEAQKIELPNQEIKPEEISFLLNNRYDGAYSLGLLLQDTLRVGQCRNDEENCPLIGNNLTLRTDGEGFKEDFISVGKDLKELIFGEENVGEDLPDETKELLNDYFESEDPQETAGTIIKKIPGEYMANSILVESFTASMGTTCRDSSCTISLYSFFDKHFNQWFSANMVFQTGAPTLWGGAKKLFGLAQRRGLFGMNLIDVENTQFVKAVRSKLWGPDAFLGKAVSKRIMATKDKYPGFNEFYKDFVQASAMRKGMADSQSASNVIGKYLNPGSPLFDASGKIPVENKKAFVQMIKDLKRINTTSEIYARRAKQELADILTVNAKDSVQGEIARTTFGGKMCRLLGKYDDDLDADLPHLIASEKRSGLWFRGIKNVDTGHIQSISTHPDQWNNIMKGFGGHPKYEFMERTAKDYKPGTFLNWDKYQLSGDGIQFYKLGKVQASHTVSPDALKDMLVKGEAEEFFVKIPGTGYVDLDHKNIDRILESVDPGDITLYRGDWVPDKVFTAPEMGDLLKDWGPNRIQKSKAMTDNLWGALRERNWADRKYFNAMDKIFSNEERLANAYFRTASGAAKYTVVPYVYWQAKRGFGVDEMSAYMLPETWRKVQYSSGKEEIYDDAFIDFFANAGSDQGDLFARVINNLPWKFVLNQVSEVFNPVKDQYDKLTKPDGGLRTKAGNIAVYSNTSEDCINCGITLNASSKLEDFTAFFRSGSKTSSIVLEDTPKKEQDNGSTLITYAHHMDLAGESPDGEPQDIKLAEAIKETGDEKTCQTAIEEVGWGVGFADKHGINPGLYLAATESAGYLIFGMGGAIGSAIQQIVVASKIQDCVDTTEGYYTHFFVPVVKEEGPPKEDTVEYSTQKVADLIDDASETMEELLTGSGTITSTAVDNVKGQLDSLSGGAKSSDLVQATFDTFGFSRGMMNGIRLFYFWAAGGTIIDPAEYKTEGKTVMTGKNGQTVIADNATGQLIVDGVPVITSEDNVRLASTNLAIPALEIPQTLTKVRLSGDANQLVFELELSSDGLTADLIVNDVDLLDCIKNGIEEQTGLPLNSDNLSDAFGRFKEMKTSSHSSVFVQDGQIIAEGIPRKVAFNDPGLEVFGDRSVKLLNSKDNDPNLGLLQAIYFDNGFILYKESTNEFIFWLKHHEDGILEQNDVFGLKVKPETQINPVTGCEEYVFDLDVLGDPDSPAKQEKVKLFNQSLDNMGPFNVFKTDKKTYVFYEDEDCVVRMKIIDNETGEVLYDEAIESLEPTSEGFEVKTSDGQTHDFGFSTEDGRPFLDYNGIKELLTAIAGKNGSLWYDPDKGLWYSENAQLLPLLDLFKQQGIKTTVDADGNVKAVPGQNLMNININDKTANNPFNLPSLPENIIALTLFVLALVSCMLFTQFYFRKK